MRLKNPRNWLAWLLLGGGALLLFLGARDLIVSKTGQEDAAEAFAERAAFSQREPPIARPAEKGAVVARLSIPRLGAVLFVVEGTDAEQLRLGPGHMTSTALPGEPGNCVIAGHRDTHFRILKDIRKGDAVILEDAAGSHVYRVRNTRVVSPDDASPLQSTHDARLNLITCYPFYFVGSAPKRFVVEAVLEGVLLRPS
jgi:sortase A